ncbi:MAG TPA: hypothetical protein VKR21_00535 [Solirubrobacteraceae bacterium]|nr:hypothetical protein [Solirubrobacteraceae bacterium]
MASCCPPGRGCNAPQGGEPCVLTLCQIVAEEENDAALALSRWEELQRADEGETGGRRRFRRRAFERARDRALQALAMRLTPATLRRPSAARAPRVRRPRTRGQRLASGR